MVGLTPLRLNYMATDVFFNTIHRNIANFDLLKFSVDNREFILGKLPLTYVECDMEDSMMTKLDALKNQLERLWDDLNTVEDCNTVEDLKLMKELHWKRSRLYTEISGKVLFCFMMGDYLLVNYESRHILAAMMFLGLKNDKKKYLKSMDQLNDSLVGVCISLCPRLETVHVRVETLSKELLCSLLLINKTVKSITIFCSEVKVTADELSKIFLGDSISNIRKNYRDCDEQTPTFEKLEYLQLPIDDVNYLDFLKFFLHYYPNTKWTSLKMRTMKPEDLSVFDGVLFYTIDMNPNHALHVCDLVYDDLRFTYLEDCLAKWVNLKSLSVTLRSCNMPLDHKTCSRTLSSILKKNKKITRLTVAVDCVNCTKFFHYIQDAVENGSFDNISDLRLKVTKLRISDLIKFIDCFPSLQYLFLDVCVHIGKSKGEQKFKTLKNLRSLHLNFLPLHINENVCLSKILFDSTTKLKYLGMNCYSDLFIRLPKNMFPASLEILALQLIFPRHNSFMNLIAILYAFELKLFRLSLICDNNNFKKAAHTYFLTKLKNSSIDYGLVIKESLDINHSQFEGDM